MRHGSPALYVDSNGAEHDSMVTAVTGTGPSGFKRVSLVYDDQSREDVPHELDAAKGGVFWRERPVEWSPPEGTAFSVAVEVQEEEAAKPKAKK